MIIFAQHPGGNRQGCLWQEAISLGTAAALRAWGVNIEVQIFSIPAGELRSILWNYRLGDKSWTWKTRWASWGTGARNSKAIRNQSCRSLSGAMEYYFCSLLYTDSLLSPWAKYFASVCTWWASLVARLIKDPPVMLETPVQFLHQEVPLEKG